MMAVMIMLVVVVAVMMMAVLMKLFQVDPGQVDGARTNNLLPLLPSLLAPTSATFVASSLRTLGYNNR